MKSAKYYMLSQKKDTGCPVGMLNAALYDKFYENSSEIKYGFFPWYANNSYIYPKHELPEGLVLIGKGHPYKFGIRNIFKSIYAINEEFLQTCNDCGIKFHDIKKIDVVSICGKSLSHSQYYAAVFKCIEESSKLSGEHVIRNDMGDIEQFRSLDLHGFTTEDIFRIDSLSPPISTIFCSDHFRKCAETRKLAGINFLSPAAHPSTKLVSI